MIVRHRTTLGGYFGFAGGAQNLMCPLRRSLLFSSQEYSRISVLISVNVRSFFHGFVYAFGSSIVTVYAMWPASVRLNVCTMCSASLCGCPIVSSRVLPLNPIVSTMSVSPSQRPTDSPNHVGSGFFECSRFNFTTWNQEFCSNSKPMYLSLCMICNGSGEFIDRLIPNGRQLPV